VPEYETRIELSVRLERETGADSIPTIARMYGDPDSRRGTLACVFPGCRFRTLDPERMWRHVHFNRRHGYSFGVATVEALEAPGG